MKLNHRATMLACYNGYITQAICINLAPLLYVTFRQDLGLTLSHISALIVCNFLFQMAIDLFATLLSSKLNLRACLIIAHLSSVLGLCGMSLLPTLISPFWGLMIAEALLGVGGGFTEVIISPLMEACPTDEKSGSMSLLHSFYSWGQAGVVLLSGIYFALFDIHTAWPYLPCLWAIIPLLGVLAFSVVPIYRLPADAEKKPAGERFAFLSQPLFWSFLCMMLCAGATEMVMSQWASSFVESTLGVDKALGDLLGPCMFALMMGLTRALYGAFSTKIKLRYAMMAGCVACILAYVLAAFSPIPALSLAGCALCGLGVGIFWPGTLSYAAKKLPIGGIAMFSLLAIAGDLGCLVGPSVAGGIADAAGGQLRYAFLFALLFPTVNLLVLMAGKGKNKNKRQEKQQ